jgi:hypothetical protein
VLKKRELLKERYAEYSFNYLLNDLFRFGKHVFQAFDGVTIF